MSSPASSHGLRRPGTPPGCLRSSGGGLHELSPFGPACVQGGSFHQIHLCAMALPPRDGKEDQHHSCMTKRRAFRPETLNLRVVVNPPNTPFPQGTLRRWRPSHRAATFTCLPSSDGAATEGLADGTIEAGRRGPSVMTTSLQVATSLGRRQTKRGAARPPFDL